MGKKDFFLLKSLKSDLSLIMHLFRNVCMDGGGGGSPLYHLIPQFHTLLRYFEEMLKNNEENEKENKSFIQI